MRNGERGWGQDERQVAISPEGIGTMVWGKAVAEEVWGVWGIKGQGEIHQSMSFTLGVVSSLRTKGGGQLPASVHQPKEEEELVIGF